MIQDQHRRRQDDDNRPVSRLDSVLQALNGHQNQQTDQLRQLKELVNVDRTVRNLEATYANLFTRTVNLEKALVQLKEKWYSEE